MSESEKLVGIVSHYFPHVSACVVKLEIPLKVGDKIKIVGGGEELEETVESMQIDRKPIEEGKVGDEIGLSVTGKVREGYKIYLQ
ncbi:MAG: hypothetical protein Athens101428_199 [Candidatus Berkelbacteria bacterium Athens1014_28]|uniref:Translation elongation factor-like protein n=1 Tax=Candidatus Berkelbacteria bacterium Athens1014_28 TaxID=2017145 RepID=A0A554LPH7_9BACT|nr:MAG: hypothetical protein Athens101428_199 [Candidatus Berkelbacteria bacterium Athens1014_28]